MSCVDDPLFITGLNWSFLVRLHICMVSETKDGQGVEPGEEKVWSLVQMLKESRKGVSPTSGKVCSALAESLQLLT